MIKFSDLNDPKEYEIPITWTQYESIKKIYRRDDGKSLLKEYIDNNKENLGISNEQAETLKRVIILGYRAEQINNNNRNKESSEDGLEI